MNEESPPPAAQRAKNRLHDGSILTKVILPLVVLGIGGGCLYAFWDRELVPAAPTQALVPGVTTVWVEEHTDPIVLTVDGTVAPFREIVLAAEVAGRILEKYARCRPGNFISKGTELIRIDPKDYDLEVQRLEKQLEQANTDIEKHAVELKNTQELAAVAKRTLDLQRKESERLSKLFKRGAITDSDLDQQKQKELSAENSFLTLNGQTLLLEATKPHLQSARDLVLTGLDKARVDLQRTTINMPVDGVIVQEFAEEDGFVQRGSQLLSVEDTSAVEVKCSLEARDLYWIWQQIGQDGDISEGETMDRYAIPPVPVLVEYQVAGRKKTTYQWSGRLARYDGIGLDEATRTFPCRVVVDDPQAVTVIGTTQNSVAPSALVRGMFVTIRIEVDLPTPLLKVPVLAIRPGKKVWIVRDGKLRIVDGIQMVAKLDGPAEPGAYWLIEPNEQIQAGDQIINSPIGTVTDGMPVEVKVESKAA